MARTGWLAASTVKNRPTSALQNWKQVRTNSACTRSTRWGMCVKRKSAKRGKNFTNPKNALSCMSITRRRSSRRSVARWQKTPRGASKRQLHTYVQRRSGSSAAPQSGVRSLKVSVDGVKVDEVATACPEPKGAPSSGCYGLSGSWSMEGAHYGAGAHTVTVTATDSAGNEIRPRSLAVGVNEAPYEAVGPGSANAKTGAFRLQAMDASFAAAGADLTVRRTYNSRQLTAGATGPLGHSGV